jgi:hypothetical protein
VSSDQNFSSTYGPDGPCHASTVRRMLRALWEALSVNRTSSEVREIRALGEGEQMERGTLREEMSRARTD